MVRRIYGLSQSPDGYVDHQNMRPGPFLWFGWLQSDSNG
jgi:hypothetical protein